MTEKEIREKAEEVVKRHYNISVHQVDSIASERLSNDIFAALAAAHRQGREEMSAALGEIKKYAAIIQKNTCAYRTTEGDGRTCDCKFAKGEMLLGVSAEAGGCAEARSIMWLVNSFLSQPDGSGGEGKEELKKCEVHPDEYVWKTSGCTECSTPSCQAELKRVVGELRKAVYDETKWYTGEVHRVLSRALERLDARAKELGIEV